MITGAAGGFGAAAVRRFAAEGANLLLSDLDKSGLDAVTQDLDVQYVAEQIDISTESQVKDHVWNGESRLGPIDIAINNAGIGQELSPLQNTSEAQFDRIMAVNAKGVFLCMKAQLPGMIARQRGTIVNVASAAGVMGAGHMAAYAASKHAVVGLSKSAADEVARFKIRVNALCPSFAPTPLFNDTADKMAAHYQTDRAAIYDRVTSRIPMRRVATIDEVIEAMLFLADSANSFMTGHSLSVDGGLSAI